MSAESQVPVAISGRGEGRSRKVPGLEPDAGSVRFILAIGTGSHTCTQG